LNASRAYRLNHHNEKDTFMEDTDASPSHHARLMAVFFLVAAQSASGQSKDSLQQVAISGFVDVYYSKNLIRPVSHSNRFRNFDITENQVDLSLVEVVIQKTASPIGFRIDADFGSTNDLIQSGPQSTLNNLQQAYVTAMIPVGSGLTVDAGKFVTHMGYEVIEAKDNWNYSRSILFAYAIPYYHTGARATYAVQSNLTVAGFFYNGWNNPLQNKSGKTLGASINFAPAASLSFVANWIGGSEEPDSASAKTRNVFDFTSTLSVTERLSIALNADYGFEEFPAGMMIWKGAALYARYVISDVSAFSLRGEWYDDPEGYTTGVTHAMSEGTLTYEYRLLTNLVLRGEFRHDWSTASVFDNSSQPDAMKHQDTFALGAIVLF
jgi:hypothetical protein